jgi:CRP-like cAMP-binding protein
MATSESLGEYRNVLLSRLAPQHLDTIRPHLRPIELKVKQDIYQPNQQVYDAYFVESGMISVVSIMDNGESIEVGTIGREGVAGAMQLLSATTLPYKYFVQLAGHGHHVEAAILRDLAKQDAEFRNLILRYQSAFLTQTMQVAACNGLHSIAQRCCRWLLMSQDRINGDAVALTHEFLGLMLGVRRASVSDVLRPLQDRRWIESNRGTITILDRAGLESGSCECYARITEHQRQMTG